MTSLPVGSAGILTSAPFRAFFVSCLILRVIACNFLNRQSRNNRRVNSSGLCLTRLKRSPLYFKPDLTELLIF